VFDYFPSESVIPADLRHPEAAAETIRRLLRDGEWSRRLPALQEARRRVLEDCHVYALVAKVVRQAAASAARYVPQNNSELRSRHTLRNSSLAVKIEALREKTYGKLRSRWEQLIAPALRLS
jgi:hypothetical protein